MPLESLLSSLEPQIAQLLARHTSASAHIDWSYREFLPLEAFHASRKQRPLSKVAYTAVETALLTEVNLPWYTVALHESLKDAPEPLQEFARIWTSEEDQHSLLLETYLLLTDSGDHAERGKIRRAVVASGWTHKLGNPFDAMVYTTVQELATQAFYMCTANVCEQDDPLLARALRRIAKDETRHYAFYRDIVKAHLDIESDYILPLTEVITEFRMPGHVIPAFDERSAFLASEHVFGPEHFYQDVIEVVCSFWDIDNLAPTEPDAQAALTRLNRYRAVLRRLARHRSAKQAVGGPTTVS